ncbi:MAG TPA: phosphate-starvation-inducible PsiE family protein [Burkholderiales bacterium]
MERSRFSGRYSEFKENWVTLSFYERFEQVIALLMTWLVAVIIVFAAWELTKEVLILVAQGLLDPLDYRTFQAIFGQIMIVLIALEFKHSIIRVVAHRRGIIQVQTVLLIALLAISRKFIILDAEMSPAHIVALASVVVALGVTYWLIRDRDVGQTGLPERVSS